MGNKALRTRLADLLREQGYNVRLYTSAKKPAYRRLKAHVLRDMISYLENVHVGTQIHDYGVNQTVAEKLKFETIRPISVKINARAREQIRRNKHASSIKKPSKKNSLRGYKLCMEDVSVIRGLRGHILWKVDQVQYESGYLSCGCGSIDCLLGENTGAPLKTKEEIVSGFLQSLYGEYRPSYLAIDYFKCLSAGIDIIDDNGFLISNYRDVVSALNKVNKTQ
jgi:hypothetical protein